MNLRREPAIVFGALEAFAMAVLGVVIIVTDMETALAGGLVIVVGSGVALLSALFGVRPRVTPVEDTHE